MSASRDEGLDQLPITHYQLPNHKILIFVVWRSSLVVFRLLEYLKVMNTFYRAVNSSDRCFEIIKTGWLLFVVRI
ncbi:hypothetical protein NDI43_11320 [Microcoleus vaginatus GB2-A3]|jgi:hypothetical protein|uniref:hypothetical protein n=1 Tax=Microcoleus TaxID=44471 RepID=UPI00020D2492|nr:hypothetical protein MicvaDRAFT_2313 [Microcoleus vaginatus FGP-2]UNU20736.1 hypothetical protein D0A34_19315 [Microcoleus vaginatus PCC 9802]